MRRVDTKEAVGMTLGHDVTKIIPGSFKGVAFRRGHVIRERDVEELLNIGKYSVFVLEIPEGRVHEDEAGKRLARAFAAEDLKLEGPREGKVTIKAPCDGLLKVDADLVTQVNLIDSVMLSTLHTNTPVRVGESLAATRIIPLTVEEEVVLRVETLCAAQAKPIRVLPYRVRRIGAVVTGNEIVEGRIRDGFDASVGRKVESYGQTVIRKMFARDDAEDIASCLRELRTGGMELILATAGLSVDPDDATLEGIRRVGAEIVFYGTPVLPGAMFLYARWEGLDILGLPACVFYHPTTAFDLFLPRLLAGDSVRREDVAKLGHGGFCRNCETCRYPVCAFGK